MSAPVAAREQRQSGERGWPRRQPTTVTHFLLRTGRKIGVDEHQVVAVSGGGGRFHDAR